MQIFKDLELTFVASFGTSRTGKTVTITILDEDGNVKATGYSAGSVYELSDGSYGVKITFTEAFSGHIRWNNTTDSIEAYQPFVVVADYRADITNALKILKNRWKIESNQLTFYDDDDTTPLYTFDLKKEGSANDGTDPDERIPSS
ncbi:MAG: hypothetical protein KC684_00765 [Candidatus Omnitrophica bacterium]|nr:hypothetical protein [Candidatus Omnitrophota bacterium]